MRHIINKNKYIIVFSIIFVICFLLFQNYKNYKLDKKDTITIACGNDASGMLFDYIINTKKNSNIEFSNIDYIQFLDCCGSQAEFAFISGRVDMAVLCPDAAFQLVSIDTNYYIVDSIVKGSNILVYYNESYDDDNIKPKNIGYMNKRLLQEILLKEKYSNSNYYPMLSTALPYALEKKTVDAVLIDIILALKIKEARFKKIDTEEVDYYLVASKKLKDTLMLNNFIKAYNEAVNDIEDEIILSNMLVNYLDISNSEGEIKTWKTMGVKFLKIKAES
ncbi:ABC transporter substrate-binding (seleno)protein SaoB [Brachyspira sp. SAP_772]|uniref:ABC transporter substrate-binding (seleno)protein SaoB n=1 Tax=Brachyspira sp. SAP_772 TaxID=2608385 RepID=UPI0012F4A7FB|nr:ABC transporter substrate-binding (seleno)protein SaoB [Brachyspira sp. SAP_772]